MRYQCPTTHSEGVTRLVAPSSPAPCSALWGLLACPALAAGSAVAAAAAATADFSRFIGGLPAWQASKKAWQQLASHPAVVPDEALASNMLMFKGHGVYSEGRYSEAELLYRQVLEQRQRVLGPEHPDTIASINNLAVCIPDIGRWAGSDAAECGWGGG